MPANWMRFSLTLVVCFAAELAMSPHSAKAQQEVFVPANDVSFTIRCERKAYRLGDPVKCAYTIRNISYGAVFVPRGAWTLKCPGSPTVWAWFEDSTGKHFIGGYGGSCSPIQMSISERMKKEAVLLRPGDVHEDYFLLETKPYKNVFKPGRYRIEAVLYGWHDNEFDPDERVELRKLGHPFLRGESVASTTIELTK